MVLGMFMFLCVSGVLSIYQFLSLFIYPPFCVVLLDRTSPYAFHDTDHAARLFSLSELGNIYSTCSSPSASASAAGLD